MSYPEYVKNWHQCYLCGCTFPDRELKKLQLVDEVLKLTHDVHACTDAARCAAFKQYRKEELARQAGLDPIRERKRR